MSTQTSGNSKKAKWRKNRNNHKNQNTKNGDSRPKYKGKRRKNGKYNKQNKYHRKEIRADTMRDRRFKKVFTDPTFEALPEKQRHTDKIQVDSRFAEMFTDPAFKTGYRVDKYGRQITNNDAYDLHKFYELNDNDTNEGDKTQNEGYEAEHEQEDEEANNDQSKTKSTSKSKLSKKLKKTLAKYKAEENEEIDEDDEFWNNWDSNKEKLGEQKLTMKEEKLLNRKAGNMFAYEADSTSSSSEESDYHYDNLKPDQVGDDTRAILDDNTHRKRNNHHESEQDVEPTKRLAVVNCDWDNITSKDLYMIFRSFLPIQGDIIKISIHPSEYGMKMMKKEERFGPDTSIWENNQLPKEMKQMEAEANFIDANEENEELQEKEKDSDEDSDDEDSDDENTQKLHQEMAKLEELEATIQAIKHGRAGDVLEKEVDTVYNKQALRKYELQKLRYYYGIAEFDSIETADRLYQECNGREYRHTCNVLSLSFVADDFKPPFETIDECTEIPDNYTAASDKQTNALGSTFLELSWDKTDPNRMEACQRAFSEEQLNAMDLQCYLQDDDNITDAGFDTDYPVTEYDTDTPNKKVVIKRRARNRYKDILAEFKEMEKNVRDSDDDSNYSEATTDATDNEYTFNIPDKMPQPVNDSSDNEDDEVDQDELNKSVKALKARLDRKRELALEQAKRAELNVQNLSSSSSEEPDEDNDNDNDIEGDQEDTFNIDDEVTNLNEWIDAQQRLKHSINKVQKENDLETDNSKKSKKRSRDEFERDSEDSDLLANEDKEPLVQNDIHEEELNDPYFKNVHDETYKDIKEPPKKKARTSAEEEKLKEEKLKERARLEMLMAGDDTPYDPENLEIDPEELSKRLNKRLKRNWRLRWLIKKAVKRKLAEQDEFKFDADDDRFKALTDDPDFAMDPTSTQFRNTKIMNKLLEQTRNKRLKAWNKRRNKQNKHKNEEIDESALIQSVKEKSALIPRLKDGQKHRREITDSIKQKGLSSFNS